MEDLSTASPLKLRVAWIVTSDRAGRLIGVLSGTGYPSKGSGSTSAAATSPRRYGADVLGAIRQRRDSDEPAHVAWKRDLRGSRQQSGCYVGLFRGDDGSGGHLVYLEANPRLLPGLREGLARRAGSLCGLTSFMPLSAITVATQSSPSRPRR